LGADLVIIGRSKRRTSDHDLPDGGAPEVVGTRRAIIEKMPTRNCRRIAAWVCALALIGVAAVGCSSVPGTPHPGSTTPPVPQPVNGPVTLSGWKLTLPVAGKKGAAAGVNPAAPMPPYLVAESNGTLTLWAPVAGSTTPNSSHTRTELDSLTSFSAGAERHVLTATVTVSQLPQDEPDVIVGQIHGADDISSIPYVMLHYSDGAIGVVVKQKQSGSTSGKYPLLDNVPLGTSFRFTISDNGDGGLTFTATSGGRTATANAPVPPAFSGESVRFQAGAYQQADSTNGGASPDDGARLTFQELTVGS
jgi:Alginate lyase